MTLFHPNNSIKCSYCTHCVGEETEAHRGCHLPEILSSRAGTQTQVTRSRPPHEANLSRSPLCLSPGSRVLSRQADCLPGTHTAPLSASPQPLRAGATVLCDLTWTTEENLALPPLPPPWKPVGLGSTLVKLKGAGAWAGCQGAHLQVSQENQLVRAVQGSGSEPELGGPSPCPSHHMEVHP